MELWVLLLLPMSLVLTCPPITNEDRLFKYRNDVNYRLPTHIKPLRYTVALEPTIELHTNGSPFNGSVKLEFMPILNAKNITLHTRKLSVDDSLLEVVDQNGRDIPISSTTWDKEAEFYTIYFENELEPNLVYNLSIPYFNGTLHLDNAGLYLAIYQDEAGTQRVFATTQFQSTNARKAFPCMDEPATKARFIIKLIHNENFTTISNEIPLIKNEYLSNGRYQDTYSETVEMSPYLLAFIVTQYANISNGSHRVFARPEAINEGLAEYALNTGIEVIDAISDFLEVHYTLGKMDQIAIPDKYFAPGAMENWGLVTYREGSLLYSNVTCTSLDLQKATTIISHEFGHQWFGNLVTLNWWKYLWLNEGFATYFEHYIPSVIHPTWKNMDQFVVTVLQYAMDFDCLNSTQPMNYETPYPGGGAPSWVSYQKAASVIRMMEHFLTTPVFRLGLNIYLTENQFGSTYPLDLYNSLNESIQLKGSKNVKNINLQKIMSTWTDQKGYPVVNASMDYSTGFISLNQSKFQLTRYEAEESIWHIPINVIFISPNADFENTSADFWLTNKTQIIPQQYDTTGCYIINKKQTGYYRVDYDQTNWQRIISYLNNDDFNHFHILNRAQLIDDSYNLARSGTLDYSIPLKLSQYLSRDREYIPMFPFLKAIRFLDTFLAASADYQLFRNYVLGIISPTVTSFGYREKSDDAHLVKLNRAALITMQCYMGDENCMKETLTIFRNKEYVPPNLQTPIYCGAMRAGNNDDWEELFTLYLNETNDKVKSRIFKALACTEDPTSLDRFLSLSIQDTGPLSESDQYSAIQLVINAGNVGLDTALKFIETNFPRLVNTMSVALLIDEIGRKFSNYGQQRKLEKVGDKYPRYQYIFNHAIGFVQENIHWSSRNIYRLVTILQSLDM